MVVRNRIGGGRRSSSPQAGQPARSSRLPLMATASPTSFQGQRSSSRQLSAFQQAPSLLKHRGFFFPRPAFPPSRSLHSSFVSQPQLLTCRNTSITDPPQETEAEPGPSGGQLPPNGDGDEADGGGDGAIGRLSSAFIFAFWAAFIAYCAFLAPNQTPILDQYFLETLLNLKGDDGFQMNRVINSLWFIMGVWPAIYWMLLIPTGRSSGNKIPVWPFASLSIFVGIFALLPYFGLWQPPSPKVAKEELQGWPLRILDSRIFAIVVAIAGAVILGSAATSGVESWTEFRKYFNSSRFIHTMSLDFMALSSLAPFWVLNDIEVRKRSKQNSWAPALAFIPFLGPALYLIIRPSLGEGKGEGE